MRILVADDEPEMTRVLEALLTREHFSVDVVHDGQDALHYGLAQNYDCLVLDIMMPELDGMEACRRIREITLCQPPVLPHIGKMHGLVAYQCGYLFLRQTVPLRSVCINRFSIRHIILQIGRASCRERV